MCFESRIQPQTKYTCFTPKFLASEELIHAAALNFITGEFSQIANVDVCVNVDVESQPVGSFAQQIFQFQGKKLLEIY